MAKGTGPDVQNVTVTADVSGFETAARSFLNQIGLQNAAIQGLMVKQVQYNAETQRSTAVINANIGANQKAVAQLINVGQGWKVVTGTIKDTTEKTNANTNANIRNAQSLAKAQQAARDRYLAQIRNAKDQEVNSGGKTFLTPSDFVRIAEATLFKSALTGIINVLSDGVQKAKEFQIQISLIRTVSQSAQLSFGQWSDGLKDVSSKLGIDIVETSKAAYEAIQSQVVNGAQTLSFLKTSGELARTTGTDIVKATDLLTATIQGFKQSITEADHTAAVLFKTVELGRIKMDELSNTLGRVAPSAGLLGISLEEVGAGLATLTRQGIKTSDANTLLINVILKLAKPTEAMKKLLNDWGFASGQAAVKTLGFVEVLRRLESTTEGRLGDLAELFNELRGLRGASGLTSAFKDYENDLKEIQKADDTYRKAIEIRAESSADRITKFNNAAKNTFVAVFGQEILGAIDGFVSKLGQGDKAARIFANTILATGGALIVGKAAMIGFSSITGVLAAAQLSTARTSYAQAEGQLAYNTALATGLPIQQAAIIQQLAFTKAKADFIPTQAASNAAMASAVGQFALLSVAVVGAIGLYQSFNREIKQNITDMSNLTRIQEDAARVNPENAKSLAQKNIEEFSGRVNNLFKAPLKLNAEAFQSINKALDTQHGLVKKSSDEFGVAYKGNVDKVHDTLKLVNQEITKSRTNIEQSKKALVGFKDNLDEIVRKTQFKYANDLQKGALYEQNIRRLTNEAEQLFAKGDEESIKSARGKFDEIAGLMSEAFDHNIEQQKKQLEENLKNSPNATGEHILGVSTIPLQNRLNQLLQLRNNLEDDYQKNQEKTIAKKDAEVRKEEERMRKLEVAVKNFTDFNIIKDGKVDQQFLKGGKIDTTKIKDNLRDLQREIFKYGGDKSPELITMYQKMFGRVFDIEKEANLELNKQMLTQDQDRLTKLRDSYMTRFREIQDFSAKFSADVFSPKGALDTLKADAQSIFDLVNVKPDFVEKTFNLGKSLEYMKLKPLRELATKQKKDLETELENVRKNATIGLNGQLLPRNEDVEKAKAKFEELKATAIQVAKLFGPDNNPLDFAFLKDGKAFRLGDVVNDFNRLYDTIKKGNQDIGQRDNNLSALESELSIFKEKAVDPLLLKYPQLAQEIQKTATPAIKNFYSELIQENEKGIRAVEKLIQLYQQLPKVTPVDPNKINADFGQNANLGVDDAEYFATGGYVHPGRPRGTDTIPAWLSPGEFVMNPQATRKFYSQLVSMNQMNTPRYYARGGYVTTNIGDVHVHMQENTQPSASRAARQMGIELRREIRRGNINLS